MTTTDEITTVAQRLNDEMSTVVEAVQRSLVQIRNGGRGAGAGTIWHPDGLVLTNNHVIDGGPIRVTLMDGRTVPGRVLARDARLDLAALSISARGLPAMTLGESTSLRPGQLVIALGHPWGILGAVAVGAVIGAGAQLPGTPAAKREWIAVNLNLRPGNSGGPLVDSQGRLVGINTMITGPEVGMAVPVHVAKEFLIKALDADGSRS